MYNSLSLMKMKIKLDEQYQEKNAAVEHLDEEIAEKSSVLTQTAALEQKEQDYYKIREELRTTKNELGSLKAMYKKVLEFIEGLNLTQKLQEFLRQRTAKQYHR